MMNQLRKIYPRILGVERVNGRLDTITTKQSVEMKDPKSMATTFFKEITDEPLTDHQEKWLTETLQELMEME